MENGTCNFMTYLVWTASRVFVLFLLLHAANHNCGIISLMVLYIIKNVIQIFLSFSKEEEDKSDSSFSAGVHCY